MYNTIRSDGFVSAPACPASHPVRMPQVAYETVWDTTKFNSMWYVRNEKRKKVNNI
jgi:hypothetical protein